METLISKLLERLEKVNTRLDEVEKKLANRSGGEINTTSSLSDANSSQSIVEYDELIHEYIDKYIEFSEKLGISEVIEQSHLVKQAVEAQRKMLQIAATSKKPNDQVFSQLLEPTSNLIQQIIQLRDKNRASKFFNHLSTISEGIAALSWVCISPTPGPYVADMRGGSEFYSNRILKDYKGGDQTHIEWVHAFNNFLKELQAYIKKNHTTGLTWNPKGGDASSSQTSSSSIAPPPPGPPPPAPPPVEVSSHSGSAPPDMSGVFAALNKGEEITKGLKKVTADMKTKNRTDKTSVVPASTSKAKETTSHSKTTTTKPPKFSLEGNKWTVENQIGNRNLVIENPEVKHTVYIYKCKDSTIQIKGKVNAITLDDCQKTGVVFDNCIASFEVVNCRSVEVQVTGRVPNFTIDKTSGCQLYLSQDALETEIITSKSDEMNVVLPNGPDEQPVEIAIPEQYKTVIRDGKLHTEIVAHV
jgi:adenylyl cyclase-associated protein